MKFQTQLNAYIQQLDCLAKDLSAASGLSPATLSRYRSGERPPDPNAPAFGQLCQGIARLAAERGLTEVTEEAVRDAFLAAEDLSQADTELLMRNFDLLLSVLDISVSRLCRRLNYDPSTVFRFRSGSRRGQLHRPGTGHAPGSGRPGQSPLLHPGSVGRCDGAL